MHPRSCAEIESEMQRPKSAAPTAANPWLRSDATDNPAITPDSPARSTLTTGLELWQSPEVERATISRVFLPADRSDPTDLSSNACAGTGEAWPVHTCVEPQPAPSDSWNYNVNGVAYADKDEAFVALQKQCEELQQAVKLLWRPGGNKSEDEYKVKYRLLQKRCQDLQESLDLKNTLQNAQITSSQQQASQIRECRKAALEARKAGYPIPVRHVGILDCATRQPALNPAARNSKDDMGLAVLQRLVFDLSWQPVTLKLTDAAAKKASDDPSIKKAYKDLCASLLDKSWHQTEHAPRDDVHTGEEIMDHDDAWVQRLLRRYPPNRTQAGAGVAEYVVHCWREVQLYMATHNCTSTSSSGRPHELPWHLLDKRELYPAEIIDMLSHMGRSGKYHHHPGIPPAYHHPANPHMRGVQGPPRPGMVHSVLVPPPHAGNFPAWRLPRAASIPPPPPSSAAAPAGALPGGFVNAPPPALQANFGPPPGQNNNPSFAPAGAFQAHGDYAAHYATGLSMYGQQMGPAAPPTGTNHSRGPYREWPQPHPGQPPTVQQAQARATVVGDVVCIGHPSMGTPPFTDSTDTNQYTGVESYGPMDELRQHWESERLKAASDVERQRLGHQITVHQDDSRMMPPVWNHHPDYHHPDHRDKMQDRIQADIDRAALAARAKRATRNTPSGPSEPSAPEAAQCPMPYHYANMEMAALRAKASRDIAASLSHNSQRKNPRRRRNESKAVDRHVSTTALDILKQDPATAADIMYQDPDSK